MVLNPNPPSTGQCVFEDVGPSSCICEWEFYGPDCGSKKCPGADPGQLYAAEEVELVEHTPTPTPIFYPQLYAGEEVLNIFRRGLLICQLCQLYAAKEVGEQYYSNCILQTM